jgi:hypothetical protein
MSDQMRCDACRLTWDTNDPEPPECNPVERALHTAPDPREFDTLERVRENKRVRENSRDIKETERPTHRSFSITEQSYNLEPYPKSVGNTEANVVTLSDLFEHAGHILWSDEDYDPPTSILDGHGQVVLALCKNCGKGEADLAAVCPNPPKLPSTFSERGLAIIAEIEDDLHLDAKPPELKCWGIARMHENAESLVLSFSRRPRDDELQHIHDLVRHNLPKR